VFAKKRKLSSLQVAEVIAAAEDVTG